MNETQLPLRSDLGPYRREWTWAAPDLVEAARLMRAVYEDREAARAKGKQARRDIREGLGVESVGSMVKERLRTIGDEQGFVRPTRPN